MTNQRQAFPVGAKVVTTKEYPGTTVNTTTYGYLPTGAQGEVIDHTEDGRAVIHFPGYGYHTFSSDEPCITVTEPPSPLDITLRRLGYDPVQIGMSSKALAEVCLENVKLRTFAQRAIAALKNAPASEEVVSVLESAPEGLEA